MKMRPHPRLLTLALLALGAGCSRSNTPSATRPLPSEPTTERPVASLPTTAPDPAPRGAAPTARMLFCAHGGVGMVPNPLPPDYELAFAVVVVELDNPGAALPNVVVKGARLLDGSGQTVAALRRLDHFVVMPPLEAEGPTLGIFAVFLNPVGTPFAGTLASGRTILRARFSLHYDPSAVPARCALELSGLDASVRVIEGALNGSWPT